MGDDLVEAGTPLGRFVTELATRHQGAIAKAEGIDYGLHLHLANGLLLVVHHNKYYEVTSLLAQGRGGLAPLAPLLDTLDDLIKGPWVNWKARPKLLQMVEDWRSGLPSSSSASRESPATGRAISIVGAESMPSDCTDPIGAIPIRGTISVRRESRSSGGGGGGGSGADASGWSQEIGKDCEELVFQELCRCAGKHGKVIDHSPGRAALVVNGREVILEWLNAHEDRKISWDLEERDSATDRVLRRHEVKARTSPLSQAQFACWQQFRDEYMVWRVDLDAGSMTRVEPQASDPAADPRQPSVSGESLSLDGTPELPAGPEEPADAEQGAGPPALSPRSHTRSTRTTAPTCIVLEESARQYCRDVAKESRCANGRFRGNHVLAIAVDPELEKRLPPSPTGRWVASESKEGCDRLLRAIEGVEGLDRMLVVGLHMPSTRWLPKTIARAVVRLASAAARCPARA